VTPLLRPRGDAPRCRRRTLDLSGIERPDLVTVDALARVVLVARRTRRDLRLVGATPRLRALLTLVGLADVLGVASVVEGQGQAEEREPPGHVEEGGERRDPAVHHLDDHERPRLLPATRPGGLVLPVRGAAVGDGRDEA